MEIDQMLEIMGKNAKEAARLLSYAPAKQINLALHFLSKLLLSEAHSIIDENQKDLNLAKTNWISLSDLERLALTPRIIEEMANACTYIADFPHPIGVIEEQWQRPNGLIVGKMRVPLGVIAIIYESRPNVTIDAAILCLRAGNAVILRGGSEALHSNMYLASLLEKALKDAGLPPYAVQIIPTKDRAAVHGLCKLNKYIDVLIPRGGEGLISTVSSLATMPVLKHDKGVCHIYIDSTAHLKASVDIVLNGKVQRPSACNALECLLIHESVAKEFLSLLIPQLLEKNVPLHLCEKSLTLAPQSPLIQKGVDEDYGKEFHSLDLVIKIVDTIDMAMDHIALYGSNHSEAICTQDLSMAARFQREVDASLILVNASTRFNDGGQLGLGAEIGISTSKLHSYGVMGVKELTTTKYTATGNYLVRE